MSFRERVLGFGQNLLTILGIAGIFYSTNDILRKLVHKEYSSEELYEKIDNSNENVLNAIRFSLSEAAGGLDTVIRIDNPLHDQIWLAADGDLRWYNPPLALASDEQTESDIKRLFKNKIEYKMILFNQFDDSVDAVLRVRLSRLQKFISFKDGRHGWLRKWLEKEDIPFEKVLSGIKVRILTKSSVPPLSFFLGYISKSKTQPLSKSLSSTIIYLGYDEKPRDCIYTYSKDIQARLISTFEVAWSGTECEVDMRKLYNIEDFSTLTSLRQIAK